ncbi:MAG: D-alanyl-D-alanine carboxypeptidase family protein [Pseudomonadota bacterium]
MNFRSGRIFCSLALTILLAACASGKSTDTLPSSPVPAFNVAAITTPPTGPAEPRAYAAMVVDAKSGKVLFEQDSEELRYPASLTKMMTLFLVFEDVKAGKLSFNTPLRVSRNAASRPPSKIGVKAGSTILVRDAVRALAVKSANDVAAVIAENLAGSEEAFARRMTRTAQALGMTKTRFVNASGLPDQRQVSTARDMAILGRALKLRHPRYSRYFSARDFTYNGRRYRATNKLLGTVRGVDGIKTGYIRLSGFNLVASVNRGNKHLLVVVFGGKTGRSRDAHVTELIERYL